MFTPQTDEEFVAWLMVFILGMIICANLDVILIGLTIYGIYSAVKATAIIILVLLLIGIIILIEKIISIMQQKERYKTEIMNAIKETQFEDERIRTAFHR